MHHFVHIQKMELPANYLTQKTTLNLSIFPKLSYTKNNIFLIHLKPLKDGTKPTIDVFSLVSRVATVRHWFHSPPSFPMVLRPSVRSRHGSLIRVLAIFSPTTSTSGERGRVALEEYPEEPTVCRKNGNYLNT